MSDFAEFRYGMVSLPIAGLPPDWAVRMSPQDYVRVCPPDHGWGYLGFRDGKAAHFYPIRESKGHELILTEEAVPVPEFFP